MILLQLCYVNENLPVQLYRQTKTFNLDLYIYIHIHIHIDIYIVPLKPSQILLIAS